MSDYQMDILRRAEAAQQAAALELENKKLRQKLLRLEVQQELLIEQVAREKLHARAALLQDLYQCSRRLAIDFAAGWASLSDEHFDRHVESLKKRS